MKFLLIVCLATMAIVNAYPGCPGCVTEIEGENLKEVEKTLNSSLSKLASGDGPSYTLVKINSATSQVVSGSKHVINADLKDGEDKIKTCNIEIWSQPWLQNDDAIQVTFDCPGEDKLVKKHSA